METVTLYRAVSEGELQQIMRTGKFEAVPSSLEGKFFAENAEDAAMWGETLEGTGQYRIVEVTRCATIFRYSRDSRLPRTAMMATSSGRSAVAAHSGIKAPIQASIRIRILSPELLLLGQRITPVRVEFASIVVCWWSSGL